MSRGRYCCRKHQGPCPEKMGNLYRFVEPIVLICLAKLRKSHGYQIAQETEQLTITHTPLDAPVIYRTLRNLEELGYVTSSWDTTNPGPAKREYSLTEPGWAQIIDWGYVLDDILSSIGKLKKNFEEVINENTKKDQ